MIQLAESVTAQWTYLASPPTHANLLSAKVDLSNPITVELLYGVGEIVGGVWTEDMFTNRDRSPEDLNGFTRFKIDIPSSVEGPMALALANLIGPGVVPSPTDPTIPVTVPTKKAGEAKIQDFDAVVASLVPQLLGTVV